MADDLRPDLCGVVFEPHWEEDFVLALIDPNKPNAWRHSPSWNLIGRLTDGGHPVIALPGVGRYCYAPAGMKPAEVLRRLALFEGKIRDRSSVRN